MSDKPLVIKFSHEYTKLGMFPPSKVILLETFLKNYSEFSSEFIEYDTQFLREGQNQFEYYSLPNHTQMIILLFRESTLYGSEKVFTTIRRFTKEKYEYYNRNRGKEFQLVIV